MTKPTDSAQLGLFPRPRPAGPPQPRTRIARVVDPETSHEAAQQLTASGARDRQAAEVLAAVRAHPGLTSRELAATPELVDADLDRYVVARRLPELEKLGLVRRGPARVCTASTCNVVRRATTWWPA